MAFQQRNVFNSLIVLSYKRVILIHFVYFRIAKYTFAIKITLLKS